jgi:hypothetical protein
MKQVSHALAAIGFINWVGYWKIFALALFAEQALRFSCDRYTILCQIIALDVR